MPHIDWSEDYETGDDRVDSQHIMIFSLLSALSDSIREKKQKKVIKETIEKLTLHIVEHFRDEEKLMLDSGYPMLCEHEHQHRKLFDDASELIEKYREEEFETTTPLVIFLTELITTHIRTEDKRLIDWLSVNGGIKKNR